VVGEASYDGDVSRAFTFDHHFRQYVRFRVLGLE
jgi:hypothetical protein